MERERQDQVQVPRWWHIRILAYEANHEAREATLFPKHPVGV